MEEVDKIIVHTLRQLGCKLDVDGDAEFVLDSFTPTLLVRAVSTCLAEIKTDNANAVPRSLPTTNMAQRFAVTSSLAEMCTAIGYRSDIGYHTFLYPNTPDVRRLLMFLIEKLPKDNRGASLDLIEGPMSEYELLRREIREKLLRQLKTPWVPQYCRTVGNRRFDDCNSSEHITFQPQLNLNILPATPPAKEVQEYLQHRAPDVFQQTANAELISSVLHKNAIDLHGGTTADNADLADKLKLVSRMSSGSMSLLASPAITTAVSSSSNSTDANAEQVATALTPFAKLSESVNKLKLEYDALLAERRATSGKLTQLKSSQHALQVEMEQLRKKQKAHERTGVVLENPQENVTKLETLIQAAEAKRKTLEAQWQTYREPMVEKLKALQTSKQARHQQSVAELRHTIGQLELELHEKNATHGQLAGELKSATLSAAPRKEYTRRIHEFIGNIRKQRNDIYRVLDDTRDLQKQLNTVTAQLQRQFSYTDDLLFQSAKHDVHAKKAYKLLAQLHATCDDLIELVSQTGNLTKESRDLQVQIDRELLKNIATSLVQITADIRNFESVTKDIQAEINKVENAIVKG